MNPYQFHEALLWEVLPGKRVQCNLCAHFCKLGPDRTGLCKERKNLDGRLYSLNYGKLIASHIDPIEKKPLLHFLPGSQSYSIASPGCNLRCQWCQNWDISQADDHNDPNRFPFTPAEEVIAAAQRHGCRSISYTYTEPTIFFEYTLDVSKLAHGSGLENVYVSNGFMTQKMLDLLIPYLDAANVDIKAFTDEAYRKYTGAHLQPVLESCERMKNSGVWLEVTTLLIPGVNDDEAQLQGLTAFIAEKLGKDTPWHVSRYFPQYKFTETPPTPIASIDHAIAIGRQAGLQYIYGGNVSRMTDTNCPVCGQLLLRRSGYELLKNDITKGKCPNCGTPVAGVWR